MFLSLLIPQRPPVHKYVVLRLLAGALRRAGLRKGKGKQEGVPPR